MSHTTRQPAARRDYQDGEAAAAVSLVQAAEDALQAAERAEGRAAAMREIALARRALESIPARIWSLAARRRD